MRFALTITNGCSPQQCAQRATRCVCGIVTVKRAAVMVETVEPHITALLLQRATPLAAAARAHLLPPPHLAFIFRLARSIGCCVDAAGNLPRRTAARAAAPAILTRPRCSCAASFYQGSIPYLAERVAPLLPLQHNLCISASTCLPRAAFIKNAAALPHAAVNAARTLRLLRRATAFTTTPSPRVCWQLPRWLSKLHRASMPSLYHCSALAALRCRVARMGN